MPLAMPETHSGVSQNGVSLQEYPARTKQAAATVNGQLTDVMVISFSDKIMVTISQEGKLSQWVQIHLNSTNPNHPNHFLTDSSDQGLLPQSHLTPTTMLGGSTSEREVMGQLYATQIADAITLKNPEEARTLVVGLGLGKDEATREQFFDLLELVATCL